MSDAGWTRADLDGMSCAVPGCTDDHRHGPMYLHSVCHTGKPQIVHYAYGGVIVLRCKICNRHTCSILIAPEHQAEMDTVVLACGKPDCKDPPDQHMMTLRAPCHRNAGAVARYEDGHLYLMCGRCKKPVGGVFHVKPQTAEA